MNSSGHSGEGMAGSGIGHRRGMQAPRALGNTTPVTNHSAKRLRSERPVWRGSNDIALLRKYIPTPTGGSVPLHSAHDYGYPDFYPSRHGQGEDTLNERTIRYGYTDMPRVENEFVSQYEMVYDRLLDTRVFQELQTFAAGVAQKQQARGAISPGLLPRLPNRPVRTDEQRDEWLGNLANSRIPLCVLASTMPYGHRGERLLESLFLHKVPLQRALWAIKLTGVYEMFGQQTRLPDHTVLKSLEQAYTTQWTKTFTQFLEHTLNAAPICAGNEHHSSSNIPSIIHTPAATGITSAATTASVTQSHMPSPQHMISSTMNAGALALPTGAASPSALTDYASSSAPGSTLAAPFSSKDQSPNSQTQWPDKWRFCLSLLHTQYSHGLLDQRHLILWLVTQFPQLPVEKCMLLFPVLESYTPEISKSRNPLRKLIQGVITKLDLVGRYESLGDFFELLSRYLISLFLQYSDVFVEPLTWVSHRNMLLRVSQCCTDAELTAFTATIKDVDKRNMQFSLDSKQNESGSNASVEVLHSKRLKSCIDDQSAVFDYLNKLNQDTDVGAIFKTLFVIRDSNGPSVKIDTLEKPLQQKQKQQQPPSEHVSVNKKIIKLLCYWAVVGETSWQFCEFRSLLVSRLIQMYLESTIGVRASEDKANMHEHKIHDIFQLCIVEFLDIFDLGTKKSHDLYLWRVCILLERLSNTGCFSIPKYFQLLTARGDFFGSNKSLPRSQRHLLYVRGIASGDKNCKYQRRILLYEFDEGSSPSSQSVYPGSAANTEMHAKLRTRISSALPFLIAYTCSALHRAKANGKTSPDIPLDIIQWWAEAQGVALSDDTKAASLPTPQQISGGRLKSPLSQVPCTKDWISPLNDSIEDEWVLDRDLASDCLQLLRNGERGLVDIVVCQRLLPLIYDYVVKDIKVGEDNWRVITKPGTSLLNSRQTTIIIRILSTAGFYDKLLDFLLWVLAHTTLSHVAHIVHISLRRFTAVWRLLGRLPEALDYIIGMYLKQTGCGRLGISDSSETIARFSSDSQGGANSGCGGNSGTGSTNSSFDFELYLTVEHWCASSPSLRETHTEVSRIFKDHELYTISQTQQMLHPHHTFSQGSVERELYTLSQRLVSGRMYESPLPSSTSADETEWTVLQCFQKLVGAAQRALHSFEPSITPSTLNGIQNSTSDLDTQKLHSLFSHIAASTTHAAINCGGTNTLPPPSSPDRHGSEALLRYYINLCAQYISWFTMNTGSLLSRRAVESTLLKTLTASIEKMSLPKIDDQISLSATIPLTLRSPSSAAQLSSLSNDSIDQAIFIASTWVTSLLSWGCLHLDTLVSWLSGELQTELSVSQTTKYTCLGGIVRSLSIPLDKANSLTTHTGVSKYHDITEPKSVRRLSDILVINSYWDMLSMCNNLHRENIVSLVLSCASAGGRLRGMGVSQLELILLPAATALAKSPWVQDSVNYIPHSGTGNVDSAIIGEKLHRSIFDIYKTNVESQLKDQNVVLPAKRGILRALLTLCEGSDPEDEGFSAMTTAEVAHKLRDAIHNFWFDNVDRHKRQTDIYKCAAIVNSLLLFASSALQETEASTDAFAVAAGANAIPGGVVDVIPETHISVEASTGMQEFDATSQCLSHSSDHVQFVTNATNYLSTCVLEAALQWSADDDPNAPNTSSTQRYRGMSTPNTKLRFRDLAEVLSTLDIDIICMLVESCTAALFGLNSSRLRFTEDASDNSQLLKEDDSGVSQKTKGVQSPSKRAIDKKPISIIKAVYDNLSQLLPKPFLSENGDDITEGIISTGSNESNDAPMYGSESNKSNVPLYIEQGFFFSTLIQRLIEKVITHADPNSQHGTKQINDDIMLSHASNTPISRIYTIACGLLGQLQIIAGTINPTVAATLMLANCTKDNPQNASTVDSISTNDAGASPMPIAAGSPSSKSISSGTGNNSSSLSRDGVDEMVASQKLHSSGASYKEAPGICEPSNNADICHAVHWRLQIVQPIFHLMRINPDEFAVDEWLMTLITLCLSPACQVSNEQKSLETLPSSLSGFYQYLMDFSALVSECVTTPMRRRTLDLLRSVAPLLRSTVNSAHYLNVLGRLFPFEMEDTLTRDLQLSSAGNLATVSGLNNPWIWIESLEFAPLSTLRGSLHVMPSLECMTPFTLRGSHFRSLDNGYLAGSFDTSAQNTTSAGSRQDHLDNPYFPKQPAFLLPLAETPIQWQAFGAKRTRIDSETRIIWRNYCQNLPGGSF